MLAALWVVLLVLGAWIVLVYQGIAIYFAYTLPHLEEIPLADAEGPLPAVAVVIAARNEEEDIDATLVALERQTYPGLEIVVVDGGSTDRTRALVARHAPRVRLLEEPPLPSGWVGKNWGCHLGAGSTSSEYLLFLDADVRLAPTAVHTLLQWARQERADLASIAPTIEMKGFWERLVLPFFVQTVLTYFRSPRVNVDTSRAAMANGQCFLVRREAYDRVGGHAAIRGYVLEDIMIARQFRAAGLRLRFAAALELAATRMYRDRREMFEGLLKNVHGTEFSTARNVGHLVGLVTFYLLPLAVLPLGLCYGSTIVTVMGAILYVALFGKHVGFAVGMRAPAVYGLLYPLAVGYYLVLVTTSLVRGRAGRPIEWKGRGYPIKI